MIIVISLAPEYWTYDENIIQSVDPDSGKIIPSAQSYAFDHIFGKSVSTSNVYTKVVEPIVDQALHGFHGTIFCYGQTSSGILCRRLYR